MGAFDDLPDAAQGGAFDDLPDAPQAEGFLSKAVKFLANGMSGPTSGDERMARLDSVPSVAPLSRPPGAGVMYDTLTPQEQSRARLAPVQPTIGPVTGPDASIGSVVSDLLDTLPQSGKGMMQGIRSIFADAIGSDSMGKDARRRASQNTLDQAISAPQFESDTAGAIYSGIKSAVQTAPGIALSIANPVAGLGLLGAQTGLPDYPKFRERGASPGMAGLGAAGTMGTEILTEKIPMGFLVSKFGKIGAGQFLSGLLAREIPGEQVATIVQDAIDTAIANPDKTWGDYARERPDAAYQTLISTITQGGIMAGASKAAQYIKPSVETAPPAQTRIDLIPDVGGSESTGAQPQTTAVANLLSAIEAMPRSVMTDQEASGRSAIPDQVITQGDLESSGLHKPDQAGSTPAPATQFDNLPNVDPLDISAQRVEKTTESTHDQDVSRNAPDTAQPILQNRDRSSAASIAQMNAIAADPDPARLSFSREFASGAPVVFSNQDAAQPTALGRTDTITDASGRKYQIQYAIVDARTVTPSNRADGSTIAEFSDATPGRIRAIAGNARMAGLQAAWERGTAGKYAEGIAADATLHGIDPANMAGIERPVLVRMMKSADVTDNIGDVSNQSGVSALNASEQARTDSARMDFDALEFDDAGNPTLQAVTRFVQNMPPSEQGGLMISKGAPSKQASERLMAATFNRAYGDPALVELHSQATDPEARIVLSGLAQAASSMARLEGAGAFDIRPLVIEAAQIAVNAARRGVSISKLAQQRDMQMSADSYEFLRYFAANFRSAKRIGEKLREIADFAYTEANKSDVDMFGAVERASSADVIGKLQNEGTSTQAVAERGRNEDTAHAADGAQAGSDQAIRPVAGAAQSSRSTDQESLLTPYTPADVLRREQVGLDAARRDKAPSPDNFSLESQDDKSNLERAGQSTLFGTDVSGAGRLDNPGADQAGRVDQPGSDINGSAGSSDLRNGGLLPASKTVSTVVAKLIAGGKKLRPSILAKAIADKFDQGQPAQLVGQQVNGIEDVAALAQIYRDPRYETFRIFYTKAGKIVGSTAVSSRLPGTTAAFLEPTKAAADMAMQSRMKDLDADGYYLLHNHPSGDPTASPEDSNLTLQIAKGTPGFLGHVIINSGKYNVLTLANINGAMRPLPNAGQDALLTPSKAHAYLGADATDPTQVALAGKAIQKPGYVAIIGTDSQGRVRMLAEMPEALLKEPIKAAAWMRRMAVRGGGGARMFLAFESRAALRTHSDALHKLLDKGFIFDALTTADGMNVDSIRLDNHIPNSRNSRFGRPEGYGQELREDAAPYTKEEAPVVALFKELSTMDKAFQLPKPESKSVEDIAREIDPAFKVKKFGAAVYDKSNTDDTYEIILPDGKRSAYLFDDGLQVWIDVAGLREGEDRGTMIYAIAAAYAHNNGRILIGDPAGLSQTAWFRRTENMISSILKYGTSKHVYPHEAQRDAQKYARDGNWGPGGADFAKGLRKIDWKEGDTAHNLEQLILASHAFLDAKIPAIHDYIYVPKTDRLQDAANGQDIDDAALRSLLSSNAARAAHLGSATLKRFALANAVLRESGEAGGRGVLADISALVRSDNGAGRTLEKSLYEPVAPYEYPARTADTMSDAIAIDSPNGRMSKRAHDAATKRLGVNLFGKGGLQNEPTPQPSEKQRMLAQATRLRDLAARGMSVKKYTKAADALEAAAAELPDDSGSVAEPSAEYLNKPTGLAKIIDPLTGRLRVGEQAYAALEKHVGGVLRKVGIASNASPAFRRLMQQYRADQGKAATRAEAVMKRGKDLPEAERNLISDVIEGEVKAGIQPPQHIADLAAAMDAAIAEQTKELVEIGMLPQETADRWTGRYLARYYTKDKQAGGLIARMFRIGVKGNHMKMRGIAEVIAEKDWPDYKRLGFRVLDLTAGDLLEKKLVVWRDWTKGERENMGEIRDAVYRFARGSMETGSDIAAGRMFHTISKDPKIASHSSMAAKAKGWVKVPNEDIDGTTLKKYGALSNMYVDPAVWNELKFEFRERGVFEQALAQLVALWKEGKTAMNPSTHAANVMSSMVMADFAGINPLNVKAYAAALRDFKNDGPATTAAKEIGLLGGEALDELKQWLPDTNSMLTARSVEGIAALFNTQAATMLGKYSGASFYRENMRKLYGAEDAFFKILIFKHYTEKGMTPQQAMDEANRYIFDYRDLPPLVKRIRDSMIGVPFISYTYKAIPAVTHSILTRPWVVAKYAAIMNAINALSFAIGGDDDEEYERKNMPDYMKGWTPLFFPTHIRVMNDDAGNPQYVNAARLTPAGSLFAPTNNTGVPMIQAFAPNNPIYQAIATLYLDRDGLTGGTFFKQSDDTKDRVTKASKYLYQQLAPATPVLPGTPAWDKLLNGVANAIDTPIEGPGFSYTGKVQGRSGREETLPKTLANVVAGVNIRAFDPAQKERGAVFDAKREIMEIRANMKSIATNQGISDAARESRLQAERAKIGKIRDRLQDR